MLILFHHRTITTPLLATVMILICAALPTERAAAQNGRPQPAPPSQPIPIEEPAPQEPATPAPVAPQPEVEPALAPVVPAEPPPAEPAEPAAVPPGGMIQVPPAVSPVTVDAPPKPGADDMVQPFAFNAKVPAIVKWLAETTGKVVFPLDSGGLLANKDIVFVSDQPRKLAEILDMAIRALRLNGVGMIEHKDFIIIYDIANNGPNIRSAPVLGPNDDVMSRGDGGAIIIKLFKLKYTDAETLADQLADQIPDQFAVLTPDVNSSQLILFGDVDLAQTLQRMINGLDVKPGNVVTRTFRLRHADATSIEENILALFEDAAAGAGGRRAGAGARQGTAAESAAAARRAQRAQAAGAEGLGGPLIELRTTTVVQQNAITVFGDPATVEQIADLIENHWDQPLSPRMVRLYDLKYTDPIKVRDKLQSLLGGEGGASRAGGRTTGAARGPAGAAGQPGSADVAVRGVFQIEAYPDSNRLIVISKTEENFAYLDAVIEAMDVPLNPNVPILVELGYADAGEVADLLNALLAEAGTGSGLQGREEGLTGGGITEGPVAGGGGDGGSTTGATTGTQAGGSTQAAEREFPWQRGRPRDDQSPESPLLGRVRIVPVYRLNALAILAPPEMRDKIRELVVQYDKPGRQVMISAIIAEVELNDAFAFGLRVSSGTITPASTENTIGMTMGFEGSRDNLIPELFTTSVLDVSANVNLLLQALAQKTNVRVLQEPRIFTSDNEEAAFFDGQDVPFIDQSQTTDVGGITQSFSYQDVGVLLNVRPRITAQRDVDVELRLKLSNVVPGQTLFGGFILDRRETNTRVVVKDGQTIVISGILTDTESKVTRGVPFLMDIPLVGELFKSRDNSTIRSELIAFITPKVVEHPSLNDTNFNQADRERLLDISRTIDDQLKNPSATETIRERIIPDTIDKRPPADTGAAPSTDQP